MASVVDVEVEESMVNPESKKQKVEEISEEDSSDDDYISEEGQESDGESAESDIYDAPLEDFGGDEKLRSQWLEMRRRLKDSDGFDVGPYDGTLIGGSYQLNLDGKGRGWSYLPSLNKCALHAVNYWNSNHKGEDLKLSKILKAVYASSRGNLFYITLEAEVGSLGVRKVYETKVMDDFIVKKIKVFLFRAKKTDKN